MKLGVFTPLFNNLSFEEMIDAVSKKGLQAVEIGTGGSPGNAHLDIDKLLASSDERREYLAKLDDKGLEISALSCHHNPISPIPAVEKEADELLRKTIKLASLMNVPVVNGFSGVSGGNPTDTQVNWPVLPWPTEYEDNYKYQWEKKLIPYWKGINQEAEAAGIKIGIELHGGFLAHTPYTMLKLREATGKAIGCNLDPSHLWWQGIDPVAAVKILGDAGAIHHFHAKDTYLDQDNINMHGLTDMQPYGDVKTRSWTFRSVGCGHSLQVWSDIISALRIHGYDYVLSIEHEDPIMSTDEGLNRAITNLRSIMIEEQPASMWWV
ncbi:MULTISPECIES: sugar phosphate isomerase/epimerase [unclassified Enterococcus]|uniref:sugar phosphate isomerase/epimerase family protein n=1 Tax=unclassified Enterococcus TaxID=2608891 RepID=UPI0015548F8D|nr:MULTISPECIES: sugar phosphate isomerase/epimerase [unclassified Enterococcus]MBS7577372.1 sugar phosphate isomerase/epimerase [Enterococcus sp. MMGLQ5-2]MBS7584779.1 sugar phosphate isomerase/epimerase [Enterococcus sp. MMGLQ5-1]NPD12634.1 sugar phosphate isomerase/epimerase [Enterococcus sp. MMGLQ5-1]NPD37206.1 sugar phosphate isomerase/epimerase [Enterococcus sp. MMGLQ5-2]